MEQQNNKKTIAENIISAIEKGKVKMKPSLYFVFKAFFLFFLAVMIFLTALFLVSLVIFWSRSSRMDLFFQFGWQGVGSVLMAFPWAIALTSLIFVLLFEFLAKKSAIVYKRPILYSLIAVFVLLAIFGFVLAKTQMHNSILSFAQKRDLGFIRMAYRCPCSERGNNKVVYSGKVLSFNESSIEIDSVEEGIVFLPCDWQKEQFLEKRKFLQEGDFVIVMAEAQDEESLKVLDLKKVGPNFILKNPPLPESRKKMGCFWCAPPPNLRKIKQQP